MPESRRVFHVPAAQEEPLGIVTSLCAAGFRVEQVEWTFGPAGVPCMACAAAAGVLRRELESREAATRLLADRF
ncbi:hypothetical protein [Saccharopolyspora cebuensis]|uniref:Uncharacterized protein n=1 Tax=Saccharopolyspora cebuensis TaxID=418759 RepID=A0ABV4CMR9_9PSEU